MTVRIGRPEAYGTSAGACRRALSRVVAIVGAVAFAVSVAGCGTTDAGEPTASPAPWESQTPPFVFPPDDGEVRVVEKGFSVIDGDSKPLISYGVVLENTSRFVASSIRVTVGLLDASGNPVQLRYPGSQAPPQRQKVFDGSRYILPGERSAIGGSLYAYGGAKVTDVVSLEVVVRDVEEWWPVQEWVTRARYCPVRTADVQTRRGDRLRVSFDILGVPPGCDVVERHALDKYGVLRGYGALVLYRDKRGRVVGGMDESPVFLVSRDSDPTLRGMVQSSEVKPSRDQVDDSRTEVHLGWDPQPR